MEAQPQPRHPVVTIHHLCFIKRFDSDFLQSSISVRTRYSYTILGCGTIRNFNGSLSSSVEWNACMYQDSNYTLIIMHQIRGYYARRDYLWNQPSLTLRGEPQYRALKASKAQCLPVAIGTICRCLRYNSLESSIDERGHLQRLVWWDLPEVSSAAVPI